MIAYTMLGSADLAKAEAFYTPLFDLLGKKLLMSSERVRAWGDAAGPMFTVCYPYDGQPAAPGNGVMVAIGAANTEQVAQLHAKALALGATNEGDPGLRMAPFYCAYVRDPDGNKLNFVCMAQ